MLETVNRALRVLSLFANSDQSEMSIAELSSELQIPKSVVHRIAVTLLNQNYLEQDPDSRRYRIGLEAFRVGSKFRHQGLLSELVGRSLRGRVEELGHTGYLGVLRGAEVLILESYVSTSPVRVELAKQGDRAVAYGTSVGKALLAALPDDQLEGVLSELTFRPLTPATKLSREELMNELQTIRHRGYSINKEETAPLVTSVGVAIELPEPLSTIAISIAIPSILVTDNSVTTTARSLFEARDEIRAAAANRLMRNDQEVTPVVL